MGIIRRAVRDMAILAGLSCLSGQAFASPMPHNLHAGSADAVAQDGDFDGDGRRDTLYLVDEPATSRVAVHVRLNTAGGARDLRVSSYDTQSGASAPRVVPAGRYATDCGSFATDCGATDIVTTADSLTLDLGDGVTVLMHWHGDRFDQDFIKPDVTAPWASLADTMTEAYATTR